MARKKTTMLILAALGGMLTASFPASAEVYKAQLGIKVEKGLECPRKATMIMWAHSTVTDAHGGPVFFRVHNNNGIKSGWYGTSLKKGSAGNYLATHSHTINITANTNSEYRIEAKANYVSGHVWSNWVPLKAQCKPKKAIGSPNKSLSN